MTLKHSFRNPITGPCFLFRPSIQNLFLTLCAVCIREKRSFFCLRETLLSGDGLSPFGTPNHELLRDMSNPESIRIARLFVSAINKKDITLLSSLMSDDHMFVDAEGNRLGGKKLLLSNWMQYFELFPDYRIELVDILSEGPLVGLFGNWSATYGETGNARTQNKLGGPAAWKARVKDGKIKSWHVYADQTETWKVMGSSL